MSSQLAKRAELPPLATQWRGIDAAADHEARAEGGRLARRGAEPHSEMDAYRLKLSSMASADLTRLGDACATQLRDQLDKKARLRSELDAELPGLARDNLQTNADNLARLRREHGPDAAAYKDAAAKAEDAQKDLRRIKAAVDGRPLRTHFGSWYLPVMVILALIEVPVNRAAFELAFREEPLFSLLLAIAVGGVLIYFAHLIGVILRQWPARPTMGQIILRAGTLFALVAMVGSGMYFLARMRQAYMHLTLAESEGFGSRLQDALRDGTAQTVAAMSDTPLSVSDWTFIAVNVLLFVFGVATSFMRHDPHPDYEKVVKRAAKYERTLAKALSEYESKVAKENERFEARKRGLEAQMSDLGAAIAAISNQADAVDRHLSSSRILAAQVIRSRCGAFADGFNAEVPAGGARMQVPSLRAIQDDLLVDALPHAA